MKNEERAFEELLEELENKTKNLEKGALPLEEAISTFEQAMDLLLACRGRLEGAEKQLILLKEKSGSFAIESMGGEED